MTAFVSKNNSTFDINIIDSRSAESLTPVTSSNETGSQDSSLLKMKSLSAVPIEGKTPSSWDSNDDILLRHLKEIKKLGWKEIAQYFSNRTPNACQFRWRRLRSGSLKHKSIAQNMELENVKLQYETELPTKLPSNTKKESLNDSSRRGSTSSANGTNICSNVVTKKKPRSRSIPTSVSPNLRQQASTKPSMHYTAIGQVYDPMNQVNSSSQNFNISSNITSNITRFRQNSLTATPTSSTSFTPSQTTVYPIVNDEQVGYIPKIKIRSRRNSTVSLSTRQQPSTNHCSSAYLDNPQSDFRNRSNSASSAAFSIERRLSVLMGQANMQFVPVSTTTSGSSNHGSRRSSGMVYYNPNAIFNSNHVVHGNTIPSSAPNVLEKRDEDVAIEDD
ncbi:hypothetical protein QEN19_003478 [Hanseniaspora menglaensis]